ncbi:phage major capsid protein [Vagococcus fessus]|uniref:Phage major capsid protein n=1 Tax=Vagococcus fessus TaxID=120370 RepID=A0A430A5D2_9ENTE|nr:phage major capsid protein [Vagococcus fessus]RSU01961.1 phage major capsid protein [Vagococcus fessus]
MLNEKIKELRSLLNERAEETNGMIDDAQNKASDGDLEGAKEVKTQIEAKKKEIAELEVKLAELEDLAGMKKTESRSVERKGDNRMKELANEELNVRSHVNKFLRSKGEKRDGLKTDGLEVIIPEDIVYTPQKEVKTMVDLSTLVNKMKVSTGSGKYPVLKGATASLVSVKELEKNPELAKPEFENVNWSVETYRGQMPISQEAIDDSAVDLTGLVATHIQEQKINTVNTAIANELKTFEAVSASDTDAIKGVLNIKLDPGYSRAIIASQSFLQTVDTLKDKNGQYILQQAITDSSQMRLFGVPMTVIADEVLGKSGDSVAFIGDTKKAILMADRVDVTAKWIDNEIYGQLLSVATRFDVKAADKKAGFFVTYKATTTPEPETKDKK